MTNWKVISSVNIQQIQVNCLVVHTHTWQLVSASLSFLLHRLETLEQLTIEICLAIIDVLRTRSWANRLVIMWMMFVYKLFITDNNVVQCWPLLGVDSLSTSPSGKYHCHRLIWCQGPLSPQLIDTSLVIIKWHKGCFFQKHSLQMYPMWLHGSHHHPKEVNRRTCQWTCPVH